MGKSIVEVDQFEVIVESKSERELRVDWFEGKEPETLLWIRSIMPGTVMWDVGANVGMYSLYAAVRGIIVYAFEPEEANYRRLCENVNFNGLWGRIWPIMMGLGTQASGGGLGWLGVPDTGYEVGASGSQIMGKGRMQPVTVGSGRWCCEQGCLAPNYLKVDVDGNELDILQSLGDIIDSPNLQSVLVEVNNVDIIPFMLRHQFKVDYVLTHQKVRTSDNNYIFKR